MRSFQLYSSRSKQLRDQQQLFELLFLLYLLSNVNILVQADIFIYAGCSQEKFDTNSLFQGNLNSFLASAVSSSSQISYNSYASGNGTSTSTPDSTLFGLYQCRGDLQIIECSRCVQSAVNQIAILCPYSYGASLQLEGCFLRYEHANFLGVLDTNLRFKKCSKTSVDKDVEFFKRRDDVLADLQTAVGFKVSSSGFLEGYVQCLGDLSSSDCTSCLGEAVGKLKDLCGSAAAADVFLGQCCARYWASGYYDVPSDSSKEDQAGKTVAIVVGIVAGLAVLIVGLSVCRRVMG